MAYLADEKGRWKQRWREIHKLPPSERLSVSTTDRESLIQLENAIAVELTRLASTSFEEESIGGIATEAMRAGAVQIPDISWAIRFQSMILNESRTIFRVRLSGGSPAPAFMTSRSTFKPRCERCLGLCVSQAHAAPSIVSLKDLQESLPRRTDFLSDAERVKLVPDAIQLADKRLFWLIDSQRAKGLLDGVVHAIDEAIFGLGTKHLVDYRIWIRSEHFLNQRMVAVFFLGEISPMAIATVPVGDSGIGFASHTEKLASLKEERPNIPQAYFSPCPTCSGTGVQGTSTR